MWSLKDGMDGSRNESVIRRSPWGAEEPSAVTQEARRADIVENRRRGSFMEGRQRLRRRGGEHRTGMSEKSERMQETDVIRFRDMKRKE